MKWIKDIMVQKQNQSRTQLQSKKEIIIPEQIKQVGILAGSEEEFELTKEVIRNLWGYKVRIIGLFYDEGKSTKVEAFSHKHFNIWGQHSDYLNEFLLEKMDFILVLPLQLNPYLRYLLLANQSSLNIGFYSKENEAYLDLMLQTEGDDLNENIQQLINYLNKIKEAC